MNFLLLSIIVGICVEGFICCRFLFTGRINPFRWESEE